MSTRNHKCSCGRHFGLRVELAVHQESCQGPCPAPAAAPRHPWRRKLLLAAVLASLVGFNLLMENTVSHLTAGVQVVLNCQLVYP